MEMEHVSTDEAAAEVPNARTAKYRFKTGTDIALLELVKHYNPYDSDNKSAAWKQIVKALGEAKYCPTHPSERTVKDRLDKLLTWFKKNEYRTKSKSGTEEQYGLLEILLTEVAEIVKGAADVQAAKKGAAVQAQRERAVISKVVENAGERVRKMLTEEDDHYKIALEYVGGDDAEKDKWMKETGLDERDWEEEKVQRESGESSDGRKKAEPAKKRGEKSPKKSAEKKIRSSRSAAAKDQNFAVEEQWLTYFRDSDDKRLDFEKKKAGDKHALKVKEAEDAREIRFKELDIEKMRIELQLKQLEEEKEKRRFGL